jgi:hypothetical protein
VTAALAGAGAACTLLVSNSMLNNMIFNALMNILWFFYLFVRPAGVLWLAGLVFATWVNG